MGVSASWNVIVQNCAMQSYETNLLSFTCSSDMTLHATTLIRYRLDVNTDLNTDSPTKMREQPSTSTKKLKLKHNVLVRRPFSPSECYKTILTGRRRKMPLIPSRHRQCTSISYVQNWYKCKTVSMHPLH